MCRRKLPAAAFRWRWSNHILENPHQKVPEHADVMCYQSKIEINKKECLVRVMVNETAKPAKVVTVNGTSKKYWKATS